MNANTEKKMAWYNDSIDASTEVKQNKAFMTR